MACVGGAAGQHAVSVCHRDGRECVGWPPSRPADDLGQRSEVDVSQYSRSKPGYHGYRVNDVVASVAEHVTVEELRDQMLRFAVPDDHRISLSYRAEDTRFTIPSLAYSSVTLRLRCLKMA